MTSLVLNLKDNKVSEQRALINSIRDELEHGDITLDNGDVYQAGQLDTLRMIEAQEYWNSVVAMKSGAGGTYWKDSANTLHEFNKVEFSNLITEIRSKRVARSDALFVYADQKKALLPLSDDDAVFDKGSWII
mgnify:CR=1 FL=1